MFPSCTVCFHLLHAYKSKQSFLAVTMYTETSNFASSKTDGQRCCTTASSVINNRKSAHEENDDPVLSGMLAERLNELSVEEREHIFDEIHGISNQVEEDEKVVAESLDALEEAIKKITESSTKAAYDLAMGKNREYVQNQSFRLMFLRAEEFNVEKAAKRIINHFKYKLELFGEQKLVKDITYDDLDCEDRDSLHTGCMQLFGDTDVIRDVKGRGIFFHFPGLVRDCYWIHNCRARWYQFMTELKDESTQRNGFVGVNYTDGSTRIKGAKHKFKTQMVLSQAIPLRAVAIHLCFINQKVSPLMGQLIQLVGERFQLRFRIHLEESPTSCLYTLQSFGIHSSTIPLGDDSRPRTDMFLKRLEHYKALEREPHDVAVKSTNTSSCSDNATTVSCNTAIPTSQDVLLGRGLKNRGNFALDIIIDQNMSSYLEASTTFEKTCSVLWVVKHIQASGGRFLKLDDSTGYWVVVDDKEACASVSSRLRRKSRRFKR